MTAYSAYLRIRHPAIDPAEITRTLGLQPVHCWTAGSAREEEGPAEPRGTRSDTYWFSRLTVSDPDEVLGGIPLTPGPDGCVRPALVPRISSGTLFAILVRQLRPHEAFLNRLAQEGGTCDLLIRVHRGDDTGLEFSPTLLRALADLQLTVSMDFDSESTSGIYPTRMVLGEPRARK